MQQAGAYDKIILLEYLFPTVNPRQLIKNMVNTVKLTKKPDKEEYKQYMRLVLLGIGAVGTIGFIIQFVFSVATYGR